MMGGMPQQNMMQQPGMNMGMPHKLPMCTHGCGGMGCKYCTCKKCGGSGYDQKKGKPCKKMKLKD
jgi:hypothetical protein